MSRAEERACECFPNEDIDSKKARFGFLLGYHQAEKDLELTWEDMQNIRNIIAEMMTESYTRNSSWSTHEEFSKEVLKRFKAKKNDTTK